MPMRSEYPSAAEAVAGQEQMGKPPAPEAGKAPGGAPEMDNPVIGAMKTIGLWIGTLKEKGFEGAEAVGEHFKAMLEALGAGQAMGAPEAEAPEAPEAKPAPSPMGMDAMAGGKGKQVGMQGMNKNAKVMA